MQQGLSEFKLVGVRIQTGQGSNTWMDGWVHGWMYRYMEHMGEWAAQEVENTHVF